MKWLLILLAFLTPLKSQTGPKEAQESFLSTQTFMPIESAKQRWTIQKYDPKMFRAGSTKVRAYMAVDLITGRKLLGKTPDEVRTLLGNFSGFFWSDYIPAYLIEEGWAQKKDTWQLVFLLNDKGRVSEVRVHKNCCE